MAAGVPGASRSATAAISAPLPSPGGASGGPEAPEPVVAPLSIRRWCAIAVTFPPPSRFVDAPSPHARRPGCRCSHGSPAGDRRARGAHGGPGVRRHDGDHPVPRQH
ncbi:MAG: hypothetical protein ACK56F_00875, partial [bacterium]